MKVIIEYLDQQECFECSEEATIVLIEQKYKISGYSCDECIDYVRDRIIKQVETKGPYLDE